MTYVTFRDLDNFFLLHFHKFLYFYIKSTQAKAQDMTEKKITDTLTS